MCLSNGLWVREIRHRDGKGAQTAILTTNFRLAVTAVAAGMFARWSQENFLKYMRQHYALDHLLCHAVAPLPATTRVVNPAWRTLERQRRSLASQRQRKLVEFGSLNLTAPIEPEKVEGYLQKKAALQADLTRLDTQLQTVKDQRAQTQHHVALSQLQPEERYTQLGTGSQDLVDTIKLVAYRAEKRPSRPSWGGVAGRAAGRSAAALAGVYFSTQARRTWCPTPRRARSRCAWPIRPIHCWPKPGVALRRTDADPDRVPKHETTLGVQARVP